MLKNAFVDAAATAALIANSLAVEPLLVSISLDDVDGDRLQDLFDDPTQDLWVGEEVNTCKTDVSCLASIIVDDSITELTDDFFA